MYTAAAPFCLFFFLTKKRFSFGCLKTSSFGNGSMQYQFSVLSSLNTLKNEFITHVKKGFNSLYQKDLSKNILSHNFALLEYFKLHYCMKTTFLKLLIRIGC